jgi:hypothetical protein
VQLIRDGHGHGHGHGRKTVEPGSVQAHKDTSEPVFLNVYGAEESIPRNEFRQPCSQAERYDNPIPTRFLDP